MMGTAQRAEWVNQVLIGIGGKFEMTPPYSDYVNMMKYDPSTHNTSIFNTIKTQSVQDILISGDYAYVAAQDSIVKYDINTYQRVAAIADSGIACLGLFNDKLLVSKQYPIVRFFMEVLDAGSLALLDRIQFISGECGDITCTKDSVFVAVNGGYMGSEGKLAVITPMAGTLFVRSTWAPVPSVSSTCITMAEISSRSTAPLTAGPPGVSAAITCIHIARTPTPLPMPSLTVLVSSTACFTLKLMKESVSLT